MDRSQLIKERLDQLSIEIKSTSNRNIELVAVTKYSPLEDIIAAYNLGHRDFGENRISDLSLKSKAFVQKGLSEVRWHFIGNLQGNKLNKLLKIKNLVSIHSVDSEGLLKQIIKKIDLFLGDLLEIYLQVNTSGESEKSGFKDYDSLCKMGQMMNSHPHPKLKFSGMMTMGKIRTDDFEEDAHLCFLKLSQYRQELEEDLNITELKLSMGMSRDYKIALASGSDVIRVGSTLFKT